MTETAELTCDLTLKGPKAAMLRDTWALQRAEVRSAKKSLDQLIADYPDLKLEHQANEIFEHICESFDRRHLPAEIVDEYDNTYPAGSSAPAHEMAARQKAFDAMTTIDLALSRYVLGKIEELRPSMYIDADLFVGKVICSSQNAYFKVTGRRPSISGKEKTEIG